ncbi:MAG TPA: CehA/McbA family metallohydrolase [Vicinamibacterales bacterium]|nr:CehA/McbA family metallohydrolase [Vicinamibacterales bacterium]
MRRLRRTLVITTAAVLAAVVLYLGLTLPPATVPLPAAPAATIYGALHIHTNRSDGSGSLGDVAGAASQAALQFVIVTDHGDATRPPEAPQYLQGVLVIDAVEITTISGHLLAMGLQRESPYPLGGEARDTLEDIQRMGGWAVAAHPDSPHEGLRWRNDEVPVDGLEWLNADSEWRDEGSGRLLLTLGHYFFRPSESIASIFSRPTASLRRWDEIAKRRNVVGLAGVDAHAKLAIREDAATRQSRTILARPSYRDMFRTVVQAVGLPEPLTGDAPRDAAAILAAIRMGRTYSVVNAIAAPGVVAFSATDGNRTAEMGESLEGGGDVTIRASAPSPAGAAVVIIRDGQEVATGRGSASFKTAGVPATYRAEVRLPGAAVPWIVTNSIRVGPLPANAPLLPAPLRIVRPLDNAAAWSAEKHATSQNEVRPDGQNGGEVAMTFRLGDGPLNGQYAAMAYPLEGQDNFTTITATLRASAPMRISVQVRQPSGVDGERWHRSVYIDETPREVTLALQDFHLGEVVTDRKPTPAQVRSVLFVIDTWHTKPGTAGTVWASGVSLGGPVKSER